jgi:hypothetical protein
MERNQTLSIALGTAGVGCTLAYLAYSHWENDKNDNLNKVTVDDVGKEAVIEDNKNNEKEKAGAWYDFIFSNSNTENEEGTQIQKKNEWDSNITLKPENKKMVKSALKDTLKQQFNESN